ncbi:MAG: 2-keto-4-pentenoate hydratase, partial [Acidimicrobiales bacterium]
WAGVGKMVRGHKVGLTAAAMQRSFGVDQPDFGRLVDGMFFGDGEEVPSNRFIQARAEPETAFVLKRELAGPRVTMADAVRAVDFLLPALEIIDSRVTDWRITLPDTIADNASSGGVVLGASPRSLSEVDLRLAGCNMWKNGELVATGATGAVLGNPLNALVWLANTLGSFGEVLEADAIVLPGSCTPPCPIGPGDVVTASFAGIGTVGTRFQELAA